MAAKKKASKKSKLSPEFDEPLNKPFPARIEQMNDIARRIYANQSVSLPAVERMGRLHNHLLNKGYTEAEIKELDLG